MRIVTLNTWKNEGDYRRRLALMAAGLADLSADVICLQECFACEGADAAWELAQVLGLHAAVQPSRRKTRRHEGRPQSSTSGLAILSRSPPLAHEALALTSDPKDGERIALRVDLADGLRVLNLHLTHLGDAGDLRRLQMAEALAWARTDLPGALVVCGDLNCRRGDAALAPLAEVAGAELGSTLHGHPQAGAIDHAILAHAGGLRVRRRFRALVEADAAGCLPSDHAAVVIDLA